MAQLNFDASNVAPNTGYDALPAGWYVANITESEVKPTKDGSGMYLRLSWSVLEGQYANRKVFQNLTLQNANAQAVEIGRGQLSAVCHAAGMLQVADSSQLHNIPMKIKLKIRKDQTGQYEDQNDVSSVQNVNYQTDMTPQAAPANPAAGFTPPPAQQPQQGAWPAQQQQAPAQQQQFQPPVQQQPAQQPAQQFQQPAQQPWQQPAQEPVQQPAQAAQQPQQQQWQQPQQQAAQQPAAQAQQQFQAPAQQQQPAQQPAQQAPAEQQQQPQVQPAATVAPGAGAVPPWNMPQQ